MTPTDLTTSDTGAAQAEIQLPELAGLRAPAPADLAPTVLIRVGWPTSTSRPTQASGPSRGLTAGVSASTSRPARTRRLRGVRSPVRRRSRRSQPESGVVDRVDRAAEADRTASLSICAA
jgi:hypothetical protein